jgi:hypothetical protein
MFSKSFLRLASQQPQPTLPTSTLLIRQQSTASPLKSGSNFISAKISANVSAKISPERGPKINARSFQKKSLFDDIATITVYQKRN